MTVRIYIFRFVSLCWNKSPASSRVCVWKGMIPWWCPQPALNAKSGSESILAAQPQQLGSQCRWIQANCTQWHSYSIISQFGLCLKQDSNWFWMDGTWREPCLYSRTHLGSRENTEAITGRVNVNCRSLNCPSRNASELKTVTDSSLYLSS